MRDAEFSEIKMAAPITPVKVTRTFTSDSCKWFCAICAEDIQLKYKNPKDLTINLWRNASKIDHCKVVEDFLDKSFSHGSDFRVVCKSCFRAAQNFRKARDQKVLQLESTRKEIVPLHLSKRIKRGVPSEIQAADMQGACGRPKSRRKIEVGCDADSVVNPFHSCPTALLMQSTSQQSSIKVDTMYYYSFIHIDCSFRGTDLFCSGYKFSQYRKSSIKFPGAYLISNPPERGGGVIREGGLFKIFTQRGGAY